MTQSEYEKLSKLDTPYWNQSSSDNAYTVTFPMPFSYANGTDTCFCEINLSIIDRTNGKRAQYSGSIVGDSGFVFLDLKDIFSDMIVGVDIHLASDSWDEQTYTPFHIEFSDYISFYVAVYFRLIYLVNPSSGGGGGL